MTEYIHNDTQITVVRSVNVTDGPVRPQPYSLAGRKYRVTKITIFYNWVSGVWKMSSAKIFGIVLKADGSDSKNDTIEHISFYETIPAWMPELIDGLRPVGVPELPFNIQKESRS